MTNCIGVVLSGIGISQIGIWLALGRYAVIGWPLWALGAVLVFAGLWG